MRFKSPRYKDIALEIQENFDDTDITKLTVKEITYPELDYFQAFGEKTIFSQFDEVHMEYASELIKIFHDAEDLEELISLALYIRDQINRTLFAYAFFVVLTHRSDTDNIVLPQYFEISPFSFFKKDIFSRIAQNNYITLPDSNDRVTRQAAATKVLKFRKSG